MSGIKASKTQRGFDLLEFADLYGAECSIQKSSLATDDAIWFGVNDAKPQIMASQAKAHGVDTLETCGWVPYPVPGAVSMNTRMHLTSHQVAELLPILQRFVATGEVKS
jgi:hypothetical protein